MLPRQLLHLQAQLVDHQPEANPIVKASLAVLEVPLAAPAEDSRFHPGYGLLTCILGSTLSFHLPFGLEAHAVCFAKPNEDLHWTSTHWPTGRMDMSWT